MKRTIFAAYLALLITAVTSFCLVWRSGGEDRPQPEPGTSPSPAASLTPAPTMEPRPSPSPSPSPSPVPSPSPATAAASVSLSAPERLLVKCGGEVYDVATEEYLVGVVAAEMPAYFEPEALKLSLIHI